MLLKHCASLLRCLNVHDRTFFAESILQWGIFQLNTKRDYKELKPINERKWLHHAYLL
jgi:hypothetical protein